MANQTPWAKATTLINTLENWPLVAIDRVGLKKKVTYRTRSGMSFGCRTRTADIKEVAVIASGLEYDSEFCRIRNESSVVVDLGANIGAFVAYIDHINKGVEYVGHAFEPYEPNYELLEENCRLNNVKNFRLHRLAVAGNEGEVSLDDSLPVDGIRIGNGDGPRVKSVRLDMFCMSNDVKEIELLKIDVEGAEYEIIESSFDFISSHVERMVVECHTFAGREQFLSLESKLRTHFEVEQREGLSRHILLHCVKK